VTGVQTCALPICCTFLFPSSTTPATTIFSSSPLQHHLPLHFSLPLLNHTCNYNLFLLPIAASLAAALFSSPPQPHLQPHSSPPALCSPTCPTSLPPHPPTASHYHCKHLSLLSPCFTYHNRCKETCKGGKC
jgi:hypothetical protein